MKPKKDTRLEMLDNCLEILQNTNRNNYKEIFQKAIDTMGSYPKPTEKGSMPETEPKPAVLAAYFYVSNARNALKLGLLKYYTVAKAQKTIISNLEKAIKLL